MNLIIGQHCKARNGFAVTVIQPVVVDEHAFGECGLHVALYFEVHIAPLGLTALSCNAHQLVDESLAEFGILNDSAQFLVEKVMRLRPVDLRVGLWKIEMQKVGEIPFYRFLLGGVVIVCHRVLRAGM